MPRLYSQIPLRIKPDSIWMVYLFSFKMKPLASWPSHATKHRRQVNPESASVLTHIQSLLRPQVSKVCGRDDKEIYKS